MLADLSLIDMSSPLHSGGALCHLMGRRLQGGWMTGFIRLFEHVMRIRVPDAWLTNFIRGIYDAEQVLSWIQFLLRRFFNICSTR
jgi:hypothetical protein